MLMKRNVRAAQWAIAFALVAPLVLSGRALSARAAGRITTDPELMTISRSGEVLHTPDTAAIYWGNEWNDATFAGDIVTGMDTFFAGFGGSDLAAIATE